MDSSRPAPTAAASGAGVLHASSHVKFFSHVSQEILLVDFSHVDSLSAFRAVADECRRVIATRPLSSVRTLVDVSGTWFDKATIQTASDLAAHNRPWVIRSAVLGVTGLRQIAFNAIVALTKRNMRMFDSREEALGWLIHHD